MRGVVLGWFLSFLMNRKQRVKIGSTLSQPLSINLGVLQGSVMSAMLFLTFIDDLLELNLYGKPSAFADDMKFILKEFKCCRIQFQKTWLKTILKKLVLYIVKKISIDVSISKLVNFPLKLLALFIKMSGPKALIINITCTCQLETN